MKYSKLIILSLLSLTLLSCDKEETKNCACNKIVNRDIAFVGVYESYSGYIYTQNECSMYENTIYVEGQGHNAPNIGDCF